MTAKQSIVQTSRPTLKIKQYNTASSAYEEDETISQAVNEYLLSYSWSMSVSDTQGSFNLTLFPGQTAKGTRSATSGYELFDCLNTMDVVEIYENVFNTSTENTLKGINVTTLSSGTGDTYTVDESIPVFIGVIKSKKYAAQMTDNGVTRRIQISGISAAGLIGQLQLDFSTQAMAVGDTLSANQGVFEALTVNMTQFTNQEARSGGTKNTIANVVKAVWQVYQNQARKISSNCRTLDMIDALDVSFEFDESKIDYYLANVFASESTQSVFDMTHTVAGEPVYETFARFDEGKPRIMIRMVPFASDTWQALTHWELDAVAVKAFDFAQSDAEVYTVFFTYLDGYPVSEQMLMTLETLLHQNATDKDAMAEAAQSDCLVAVNEEKYAIYGYRLLNAKFRGYHKENDVTNPRAMMQAMNENMKAWFGSLDEMLSGSVSLAMTGGTSQIMPGDVASFLGCEFYIEGVSHSWEVNRGGDINLSLTRGGAYTNGVFSAASDITEQARLLEGRAASDDTKETS